MSILSIDNDVEILTGMSIIDRIQYQLVDNRYRDKLRSRIHCVDPGVPHQVENIIEFCLRDKPFSYVFLPITWVQIFSNTFSLKYTKRNPGFQLRFRLYKHQGYRWESEQKPAKYILDIKAIRTAQSGQLIETFDIKVWIKPEYNEFILDLTEAVNNTTVQL